MPQICWCGNKNLTEYSADYWRCEACHTLVTKTDIQEQIYHVQDEASDLYGSKYWSQDMLQMAGVNTLDEMIDLYLSHRALYWMGHLLQHRLPPATVAEIGGGLGQFSFLLKQVGFQQVGYELSREICNYSHETLGINMLQYDFTHTNQKHDLLVAMDLIEHILEVDRFVAKLHDNLNEGGIVCLQTPVYDETLTYEEMLEKKPRFSSLLRPEQHIYLFSRVSMEQLLRSHGFSYIEFQPAVFGDDYDMFLFASQKPFIKNDKQQIAEALNAFDQGRLIKNMLDVFEQKQKYIALYQESEKDRSDRLILLQNAEKIISDLQQENTALNKQLLESRISQDELAVQMNNLTMELDTAHRNLEKRHKQMEAVQKSLQSKHMEMNNLTMELDTAHRNLEKRHKQMEAVQKSLQSKHEELQQAHIDLNNTQLNLSYAQETLNSTQQALHDTLGELQRTRTALLRERHDRIALCETNSEIKPVLKQLYRLTLNQLKGEAEKHYISLDADKTNETAKIFKIAVDVTPIRLDGSVGGAMNLTIELIKHFSQLPQISLLLLTGPWNLEYFSNLGLPNTWVVPVYQPNEEERQRYLSLPHTLPYPEEPATLLSTQGVDVLFCPFGAPTFREYGIPMVCTVNDIQHEYYPQFFCEEELQNRRAFYNQIIAGASSIVSISDYTKQSFLEKYNYPAEQIHTIPIAIQDRFEKNVDHSILAAMGLEQDNFILYPANFWEHKNHKLLLVAFSMYVHQYQNHLLKLVLTGNPLDHRAYYESLCAELGIASQVLIAGYVSELQLQTLYAAMKGMCFPSLFEGFGIPVIEAMCFNKPVACSNTTSLAEIGKDSVHYFDPTKADEIVGAIAYLSQTIVDDVLTAKYQHVLSQYDSDRMVQYYIDVFRSTAERGEIGTPTIGDIVSGIYPDQWSREQVIFRMGQFHGSTLVFDISLPDFVEGVRRVTLTAGRQSKSCTVRPGKRIPVEIRVAPSWNIITMDIAPYWQPSAEDTRKLGIMMNNFMLENPDGTFLTF